jgi:hypothetical protein
LIEPLFQAPGGVTGNLDFGQGGSYLTDKKSTGVAFHLRAHRHTREPNAS